MAGWGAAIAMLDAMVREAALFAACGFLLGGLDDLAVDFAYLWLIAFRPARAGPVPRMLADITPPGRPGRYAIFIPAWDESAVIGATLRHALATFDHPDYRIYVGTYPNDRATIDAVAAVGEGDGRVRLVIGDRDGPTTKAQCLNTLWRALLRDEAADGARVTAIVLHDAEDIVHRAELSVFDALIGGHDAVQLPVMPLVDPRGPWISGHYADEFAESHGKTLPVRQALGAGLPLAGVGCAIARESLGRIADSRAGAPFDIDSLTEDYELGLHLAGLGASAVLARVREYERGPLVAVRAYFPATFRAAWRQKARWMVGIALAGWDRVGWSENAHWREHWMRMRDRRGPLAMLALAAAYIALAGSAASGVMHGLRGEAVPRVPGAIVFLLWINGLMLVWRLAVRAAFTGREYGARAALVSFPRALIGNVIALLAARRAFVRYIAMLRGAAPRWDKTAHSLPPELESA